jgi:MFS family permease
MKEFEMDRITNIDNLTRTTRRRDFDDGLMDFVFAGTFLFIGLLGGFFTSSLGLRWYISGLLTDREITIIVVITPVALFILLIAGARRMIARIRRRTLWRNRGFLSPLRWQVSWQTNAIAVAVMIAMLVTAFWLMLIGVIGQESVLRTLVSSAGVATGLVLYGMAKDLGLPRYKWIGVAGGASSALITFIPIAFSNAWLALGIGWMILFSLSGLWALRKALAALGEPASE